VAIYPQGHGRFVSGANHGRSSGGACRARRQLRVDRGSASSHVVYASHGLATFLEDNCRFVRDPTRPRLMSDAAAAVGAEPDGRFRPILLCGTRVDRVGRRRVAALRAEHPADQLADLDEPGPFRRRFDLHRSAGTALLVATCRGPHGRTAAAEAGQRCHRMSDMPIFSTRTRCPCLAIVSWKWPLTSCTDTRPHGLERIRVARGVRHRRVRDPICCTPFPSSLGPRAPRVRPNRRPRTDTSEQEMDPRTSRAVAASCLVTPGQAVPFVLGNRASWIFFPRTSRSQRKPPLRPPARQRRLDLAVRPLPLPTPCGASRGPEPRRVCHLGPQLRDTKGGRLELLIPACTRRSISSIFSGVATVCVSFCAVARTDLDQRYARRQTGSRAASS